MKQTKYEKIKGINSFDNIPDNTRKGQWFIDNKSIRAQYLGTTKTGTIVMNYKRYNGQIDYPHMIANKALRGFAIKYGSK
jgi:hypothetical protein